MFEKYHKCEQGLKCQNEYATLKPGYWWSWRNKTHKDRYRRFVANLLTSSPALGDHDVQYPYPLPKPYKCPEEESCEGDIHSTCKDGYKGPLCSVCGEGHYKQMHQCKKCPSKKWIAGKLLILFAAFWIIFAFCVWTTKRKNSKDSEERSVADTFLSKIKIGIGFYQVTYGLLEAFSYIEWPESVRIISKYSEILQLNILEMAPVHCLFPGLQLQVNAFANLFAIMTINAALIVFAGVIYGVRKLIILRNEHLEEEEKLDKISQVKENVYRNLFFFLYVTYLSTCSKTATVLPLACRDLCRDENEELCLEYLKADYSIQCHDNWYHKLVIVAYISTAYVITLPFATFIALWRQRKEILATGETHICEHLGSSTEMIKGLHFLYENYKASSWYWELVEMSRKVIVTSGLILVGQESRSYIGLVWVVAGMYGVLFAWNCPIQDVFENRLMTTSLAVTVFNLGVGAVSKIPAENLPASTDSYMDTVVFDILILGANSLVIGLLAFQYVVHLYGYLKEWRKNPHWPFSCCLALILPLISLPGEINHFVGTNIINNQLQTGDIEMPTIAASVQDSGAIEITLESNLSDDNPAETQDDVSHRDAQPYTREIEMSSNVASAQDNRTLYFPLEKGKQRYRNPVNVGDNRCSYAQPQTGEKISPTNAAAVRYTEATAGLRKQDNDNPVEVQQDNCQHAKCNTNKCHQWTQTEISTIVFVVDAKFCEPAEDTPF